jgi:hypothetical protein
LIILVKEDSFILVRWVDVVAVVYLETATCGDELGVFEERPEVLETPSLTGPTSTLAPGHNHANK